VAVGDLPSRLGNAAWLAVVGRFDPLTLAQANRLSELLRQGRSIVAVVQPAPESLLPVEARAALVAALRSVRLVVIADASLLPSHPRIQLLEDEPGERKRSEDFVAFIAQRQGAGLA
jgi:hypothetical protein